MCRKIPNLGPRSVPLQRPVLITVRAYVNPSTGVGPDANELVTFRTLRLTPRQYALTIDTTPRYDSTALLSASHCAAHLVESSQCGTSGVGAFCCGAMRSWNADGCWCSEPGKVLLGSMPRVVGPALTALSWSCNGGPANRTCNP